jgi:hypothetical protein
VTKRPEENDIPDMEAGMTTAERRRRRRRGAGLRVPSDNVPRRSGNHAAVPIPPGVPGDESNLGVSIAYNFSDSGPVHRSELHEAASAAAAQIAAGAASAPVAAYGDELDDDGEATMAGPQTDLGLAEDDDGEDYAEAYVEEPLVAVGDDEGFDTKTREMPALRTPLGALRRPGSVVDAEVEAEPAAEPASRDSVPGRRAGTVALSDDDLEELVDIDVGTAGAT